MTAKVVTCPKCQTQYDASKAQPGAKVRCRKCGTVFSPPAPPSADTLVGKTIGGYEILEKLGEGGIGAVYKARQISLSRLVAIKTLRPEFANNASFVARLLREARSAAQISHPNIVQTIDVGSDKGVHFIAMELVQGEPLSERIAKKGRLSVAEALDYLEQAARALDRAHEAGIIHRDIKPENLIVTKSGEIKLMDFGLAKRPDADVSVTQEGTIAGTPRYMSPEQGQGKAVDGRSDIYSLGATIYHGLCGTPPFEGATAVAVILKHVSQPLPPIRTMNPQVTPKLAAIIEQMLAKKPADRFQKPGEILDAIADARATLAEDLEAVRKGGATAPTVVSVPTTEAADDEVAPAPLLVVPERRPRLGLVVGVTLLAVAVAITGVVLALRQIKYARQAQEQEYEKLVSDLNAQSRLLAYEDRYREAIAVFDQSAGQNVPEKWHQKINEAKQELLQEAQGRFKGVCAEAESQVKEKRYTDALERYLHVAEKYGIPEIKEEATKRSQELSKLMESEARAMLEAMKESGRTGQPEPDTVAKYNELTRLYPGTRAAREAEELFENLRKKTKGKLRPMLTVSKDGRSDYTSIRAALAFAVNGSTVEIRDDALYDESDVVSQRMDVRVRGAKDRPPVIRASRVPKREPPPGPPHRWDRFWFGEDFKTRPFFSVQSGWHFENLILDGVGQAKGIMANGSLRLENCLLANMRGSAILSPGKGSYPLSGGPPSKKLEVSNCVFLEMQGMPALNIDQSGGQEAHLEFTHNLVCRVREVFRRSGDYEPNGKFVVTKNIFAEVGVLLYDPSPERNGGGKTWKFDENCYSPPGPTAYLQEPRKEPVTDFKAWQARMGADQNSMLADPMFVDAAAGNLALRSESPCAKAGMGPKGDILACAKLLSSETGYARRGPEMARLAPEARREGVPERGREVPAPPRPAETKPQEESAQETQIQKTREGIRSLLAKNQYAEALKTCDSIKGDGTEKTWKDERISRIKRLVELKKLIIERVNAKGDVPVPSSLWQRKRELSGGVFSSAAEGELTGQVKENEFKLRWEDLTPDDVRLLAEECTNRQTASEQIAIGIFCIEQGITSKAGQYFNYAKSSPDKTPALKEEADRFLVEVQKALPQATKPGGK